MRRHQRKGVNTKKEGAAENNDCNDNPTFQPKLLIQRNGPVVAISGTRKTQDNLIAPSVIKGPNQLIAPKKPTTFRHVGKTTPLTTPQRMPNHLPLRNPQKNGGQSSTTAIPPLMYPSLIKPPPVLLIPNHFPQASDPVQGFPPRRVLLQTPKTYQVQEFLPRRVLLSTPKTYQPAVGPRSRQIRSRRQNLPQARPDSKPPRVFSMPSKTGADDSGNSERYNDNNRRHYRYTTNPHHEDNNNNIKPPRKYNSSSGRRGQNNKFQTTLVESQDKIGQISRLSHSKAREHHAPVQKEIIPYNNLQTQLNTSHPTSTSAASTISTSKRRYQNQWQRYHKKAHYKQSDNFETQTQIQEPIPSVCPIVAKCDDPAKKTGPDDLLSTIKSLPTFSKPTKHKQEKVKEPLKSLCNDNESTTNPKLPSTSKTPIPKKVIPSTKVIVRLLPPKITKKEFFSGLDDVPEYNYFSILKAEEGFGKTYTYSTIWINFLVQADALEFIDKIRGKIFRDLKDGRMYFASPDFALFQNEIKGKRKNKYRGTLEHSRGYQEFLSKLDEKSHNLKKSKFGASMYEMVEDIEAKKRNLLNVKAPLVEHILMSRSWMPNVFR